MLNCSNSKLIALLGVEMQMKAKMRKRFAELTKLRAKKNRLISEISRYADMLASGQKVINGRGGFQSVAKLRDKAVDELASVTVEIVHRRQGEQQIAA